MKVIFLTEASQSPSTRFRVVQYIPELKKRHFDITVREIPKRLSPRLRLINTLSSFDVVVLQRRLFQWWILWLIRKKSGVLVYDFDDAVLFRDSNSADLESRSRLGRFKNTLKTADLVIAGNEYLKKLCVPFAKKTEVVATGIDVQKYRQKPQAERSSCVTVGWIGTRSNLIYLKDLIEPINRLYESRRDLKLKIVCDGFIDGFACPLEKKIWTEHDEVNDIQSFDIGVLPLIDDKWTRGKCALKLLQYMSCGLASVSSRTEVTSRIIRDGTNGFLASGDTEWLEKLTLLVERADKRISLGVSARKSLSGAYDAETISRTYARLFEGVLASKRRSAE